MQTMRRDLSWSEIVQKAWGKEWNAPEIAYEFTNRKFYDRRGPHTGDGIVDANAQSVYADNYADDYS